MPVASAGSARLRIVWALTAILFAAAMLCRPVNAESRQWGAGYMPNVTVIDQDGRKLKFYDDVIKNKIVVVSFIYTVCRDLCPLMTARLAQFYEHLGAAAGRDFFFVSISIDPERDTPEQLKQYADGFRTGPGWLFLTGARADIDLIRDRLGERSKFLNDHRNQILLGNDRSGVWARDSAFADMVVLESNLRSMDHEWLYRDGGGKVASEPHRGVAPAQELPGQTLFVKTCGSCHTIGRGPRVGPDLAGLLARRERGWIERYIAAPEKVRASGDPIAAELSRAYKLVRMPNLSMSREDIADLMRYIEVKSGHAAASTGAGARAN